MSTDFRALCQELLIDYEQHLYRSVLADRARAALAEPVADGPAVQSREPASVATQPSDDELLELSQFHCVSITLNNGSAVSPFVEGTDIRSEVLSFARAAISRYGHQPAPPVEGGVPLPTNADQAALMVILGEQWLSANAPERLRRPAPAAEGEVGELVAALRTDAECVEVEHYALCNMTADQMRRAADLLEQRHSAPAPPAEGEVAELVAWLRMQGEAQKPGPNSLLSDRTKDERHAAGTKLTRAADLLERRHPTPVPVSKRLPGPEDCDEEGLCWWFSPADPSAGTFGVAACWVLRKHEPEDDFRTHWLPFTALPLPQGEVQP